MKPNGKWSFYLDNEDYVRRGLKPGELLGFDTDDDD